MKFTVSSLVVLLFYSAIYAQSTIPSSITSNKTLTKAGSPYKLTGKVVVFQDVTLTIEPGVVILCDTLSSIEVRGTLTAIGAQRDSIKFKTSGANLTSYFWQGIKVLGTDQIPKNQVTMKYVKFSNSKLGIDLDFAYDGPYVFEKCEFSNNYIVFSDAGAPETRISETNFLNNGVCLRYCQFDCIVDRSNFIGNKTGIDGWKKTTNCYFTDNELAMRPYGIATNNIIVNNVIGAEVGQNAVNKIFTNNVVENNQKGINASGFMNFQGTQFFDNQICNNTDYDIKWTSNRNANIMNNCWCSQDSTNIRSKILDGHQDNQYGLVKFIPFKTTCNTASSVHSSKTAYKKIRVVNPFTDNLNIGFENQTQFTLLLYDLKGQIIFSEMPAQGMSRFSMDHLSPGVYLYIVEDEFGEVYRGKVTKVNP
ncbi:MAG: hypothetical protein CL840_19040 [Crocinitomicaceae bacterium]|nr:hypothetical protein [Crocinitomicaceae bacterium]|tara:strand:- start:7074 stop:8339 length:1266 start_codon:yes stop_codon:yes gene_type:complete